MRKSALILGVLTACTPLSREDDWPESQAFDRVRVDPSATAPVDCDAPAPASTFAVDPDLVIDLERKGSGAMEPGQWVEARARIRNTATEGVRRVPMPGDGSEVAWREPHVWWSAFVHPADGGCALAVAERVVARCGVFDHNWHDDVARLGSGDAADMEWLGNPSYMLDLAAMPPGEVTMFLHYAFTAGDVGKGGAKIESRSLGPMRGQSAFEVVSNPIIFDLETPLHLELAAVATPPKSPARIRDVFTLTLKNTATVARTIAAPVASRLRFEVKGSENSWPQANFIEDEQLPAPRSVDPEGSLQLIGPMGMTPNLEYAWVHPKSEAVRVRAYFRPYVDDDKRSVEVASDWVEVQL